MKSKIFLIGLLFFLSGCRTFCQTKDSIKFMIPSGIDTLADSYVVTWNLLNYHVNEWASVLNSDTLSELPDFINNYCIDEFELLWPTTNTPVSFRKLLLDKVTNKNNLLKIINSNNENYKKLCTNAIYKKIPFSNYSWHDLCLYRLEELKLEYELNKKNR